MARRALEVLSAALDLERAAVFLEDLALRRYVCVHAVNSSGNGPSAIAVPTDGALGQWVRSEKSTFRIQAYDRPVRLDLLSPGEQEILDRFDAAIITPIWSQGRPFMFLLSSFHRNGRLPDSVAVSALDTVAHDVARAVGESIALRETIPEAMEIVETTSAAPTAQEEAPGSRRFGAYELESVLGAGGFGEVWRARHISSGRTVALKTLRRDRGSGRTLRQFLDEITIMAALDDPHVVKILDYGNSQGAPWFAMELIEGETLRAKLSREARLHLHEALEIGSQIAGGLAACHAAGILHRDLSPSNIFLAGRRAYVGDLGLAYRLPEGSEGRFSGPTGVAGTILYMSPEQTEGKPLGPTSDLFSLGSILYESLTGRPPFASGSVARTIEKTREGRYDPLQDLVPSIPPEVEKFVESLLARDPSARPARAGDVARALKRFHRRIPREIRVAA